MTAVPAGTTLAPAVVVATGLGKAYRRYASARERFKALWSRRAEAQDHQALRGVSFAIQRGECLGVVGDNGAGKSTLLKLLTGTVQPTTGSVECRGRTTAILELGAGFHPDFTGRENLYFGGQLIGIGPEKMDTLLPSILAFSGLAEALDRPVKTYSSGMVVRLAFSLVTAVQPDLLIIDEALAVGDQNFQKKCIDRITQFKNNGCTILFCSHSLYHVRQLCNRALWLSQGEVAALGETEAVLTAYEASLRGAGELKLGNMDDTTGSALSAQTSAALNDGSQTVRDSYGPKAQYTGDMDMVSPEPSQLDQQTGVGRSEVLQVTLKGVDRGQCPMLLNAADLTVEVWAACSDEHPPTIGVMLEKSTGEGITTVASHVDGVQPRPAGKHRWALAVVFNDLPLMSGDYMVSVYLGDHTGLVVYDERLKCTGFRVVHPSVVPGLVRLPHQWTAVSLAP